MENFLGADWDNIAAVLQSGFSASFNLFHNQIKNFITNLSLIQKSFQNCTNLQTQFCASLSYKDIQVEIFLLCFLPEIFDKYKD